MPQNEGVWSDANWVEVRLEGVPPEVVERIDQLRKVEATHHTWVFIRDALQFYEEHLRREFPTVCALHIEGE